MITDEELERILHAAGEALPLPDRGPGAILDATTLAGVRRRPRARTRLVLGGLGAVAASTALVLALTLGGSQPRPIVAASGGPERATSRPAGALGSGAAASGVVSPAGKSPAVSPPAPSATGKRPATIASTGRLELGVDRTALERSAHGLERLAQSAGGYVVSTDLAHLARTGQASVVLRVPARAFVGVVGRAERFGALRSLTTANRDVTTEAADQRARLQALEDVRNQLEVLLRRSGRIADLLLVANQIQTVGTQIDEVGAEQRALEAEVTYATLTVHLVLPSHQAPARSALARAWSSAVNGLSGGLRWLLSIAGDIVFALLVLVAGIAIALLLYRRLWPRLRRLLL